MNIACIILNLLFSSVRVKNTEIPMGKWRGTWSLMREFGRTFPSVQYRDDSNLQYCHSGSRLACKGNGGFCSPACGLDFLDMTSLCCVTSVLM